MLKPVFMGAGLVLAAITAGAQTAGQPQSLNVDVANLRSDVTLLTQQVGQLSLRVEQLENANATLTKQAGDLSQNFATIQQLQQSVGDLNAAIKAGDAAVAARAAQQIQALGNAVNAALAQMSQGSAPTSVRTAPQPQSQSTASTSGAAPVPAKASTSQSFSGDYPQTGISYIVRRGDTIGVIARKTGARETDIINANKLVDPSRIQVGQALFIPGGK